MARWKRPNLGRLSVVVTMVLLLAACGNSTGSPGQAVETTVAIDTGVSAIADNGEVALPRVPRAIISLSPTLTEMLWAVGAGDQVIAVDGASNHPEGVPATDLSGFRPNVEAIAALEPDLVLISRDREGIVDQLGQVGIPAAVLGSAGDLEDVYRQIGVVGALTGHGNTATQLITEMRDQIDRAVASVPPSADVATYFYELSDDFHSLTSDTFVGDILSMFGLENIADGVDEAAGGFPQLSAEYVLGSDPDYVFVAHTDGSIPTVAELATRPGWANLRAVTEGSIVMLDPDVASRWGPRVVELVVTIAEGLQGAR